MLTHTNIVSAVAVAAMLTAFLATSSALAGGSVSKGGHPVKKPSRNPIVNTIHPIIRHPPLHGPGSSHNPIVVSTRDCNDPSKLCRRP